MRRRWWRSVSVRADLQTALDWEMWMLTIANMRRVAISSNLPGAARSIQARRGPECSAKGFINVCTFQQAMRVGSPATFGRLEAGPLALAAPPAPIALSAFREPFFKKAIIVVVFTVGEDSPALVPAPPVVSEQARSERKVSRRLNGWDSVLLAEVMMMSVNVNSRMEHSTTNTHHVTGYNPVEAFM